MAVGGWQDRKVDKLVGSQSKGASHSRYSSGDFHVVTSDTWLN